MGDVDSGSLADRFTRHLAALITSAMDVDEDQAERAIAVADAVVRALIEGGADPELLHDVPVDPPQVLRAVLQRLPDGKPKAVEMPLTPLLDTTLLTNAPGEPAIGHEIRAEIASADGIDVVMAFIRWSGVRPLLDALRRTAPRASRSVSSRPPTPTAPSSARSTSFVRAGAEVRVSYDTTQTRLHAKAWVFHRASGYSTAYIGSSNLTHSAQVTGLEWNVRVSGARNPDVVAEDGRGLRELLGERRLRAYDPERVRANGQRSVVDATSASFSARSSSSSTVPGAPARADRAGPRAGPPPQPARRRDRHRQDRDGGRRLRAPPADACRATGCSSSRTARRSSSRASRRSGTRFATPAFGELWVGGHRPQRFEHVFASIQSLNAAGLAHLDPDHFDVVIVDEFHHAAAPSYERVLEHRRARASCSG